MKKGIIKFNLLFILTLLFVFILGLFILIKPGNDSINTLGQDALFEIEFQKRLHQILSEKDDNAEILSEEGRHGEAAVIFIELAATRQCLFPESILESYEPTMYELRALRELGLNSEERDAYATILRIKYPDWNKAK